jgi:hypothetical protein
MIYNNIKGTKFLFYIDILKSKWKMQGSKLNKEEKKLSPPTLSLITPTDVQSLLTFYRGIGRK